MHQISSLSCSAFSLTDTGMYPFWAVTGMLMFPFKKKKKKDQTWMQFNFFSGVYSHSKTQSDCGLRLPSWSGYE